MFADDSAQWMGGDGDVNFCENCYGPVFLSVYTEAVELSAIVENVGEE